MNETMQAVLGLIAVLTIDTVFIILLFWWVKKTVDPLDKAWVYARVFEEGGRKWD